MGHPQRLPPQILMLKTWKVVSLLAGVVVGLEAQVVQQGAKADMAVTATIDVVPVSNQD